MDYDARVWAETVKALLLAAALCSAILPAQEAVPKPESPKSEPQYDDTFSGSIVEFSQEKITVSRSNLGKDETRSFVIKPDTKIEGKLRVKVKVTVGFVAKDEGDEARLIVVRPQRR